MVINLSSKNGNSLVWPEKNTRAEQLHSYARRTLNRKKHIKAKNHSIKRMHFLEMLPTEISVLKPAAIAQTPSSSEDKG